MMNTNYTTITPDEFVARARRQAARSALLHPGRSDEYYAHYRRVLRETAPVATPQRMERRTTGAQALFAALATADRSEQQIRTYPPARRRQMQQRVNQLRLVAKRGLRKLGYTNV